MFRKNDDHRQMDLFNSADQLDPRIRRQLENSWAPMFYEHVFCQIDEEPFAVLYAEQYGRPNFPVNILLGLEIIAAFKDYTVEETLEQFYFNLQIQWALGIRNIGECPLAERTIYQFRERLYAHALETSEDLILQQFMSITNHFGEFMGLISREMRMDSTMLMSNIRRAGRLSLSYDVLHKAVRAIPSALLPEDLAQVLKPDFKKELLYRVKTREIAGRFQEMLQLCAKLLELVSSHEELQQHEDVKLVARFLTENGELDQEQQEWVAKKKRANSTSNHLHSAHDPDATCRVKGDTVHIGYVANLAETCSDDNPVQIITDYILEKNNVADQTMARESIPRLKKNFELEALYVDGGYSGESVYNTAQKHDVDMYYTNMTGKESSKLPLTKFRFDGNKVTHCPAGYQSILSLFDKKTGTILTHFDNELCRECPLQRICPTIPRRNGNTLSITPAKRIAAETRKQLRDKKQHKINTSKRAAIEGTNSALKRSHGADKLRARGHNKCQVIFGFKVLAHNFKQLVRYIRGDIRRSLQDALRQHRKGLVLAPIIT